MIDSLRRVAVYPGGFHRAASLCRPAGASPTTRAWGLRWIRPIPYWKLSASPTKETKPAEEHHRQTTLVPELSTDGAGPPCRWEWSLSVPLAAEDRKSTRLNSSHLGISYAVFCLIERHPLSPLFPYTTLFRSPRLGLAVDSSDPVLETIGVADEGDEAGGGAPSANDAGSRVVDRRRRTSVPLGMVAVSSASGGAVRSSIGGE